MDQIRHRGAAELAACKMELAQELLTLYPFLPTLAPIWDTVSAWYSKPGSISVGPHAASMIVNVTDPADAKETFV